ncbi:hypothetical protein Tco_0455831 [Tanacetum coccineum]
MRPSVSWRIGLFWLMEVVAMENHVSLRFATRFIYAWLRLATLMHVLLALAFLMPALPILDLLMCRDCVSLGCDDPLTMLCDRRKWKDGKYENRSPQQPPLAQL